MGLSVAFGMLDIVNIAHPAFVVASAFIVYAVNAAWGLDPILAGILLAPAFFLLGLAIHRIYYASFERRAKESLRGLAFFFGLLFITEVALILAFGVDYRLVETPYLRTSFALAGIGFPMRLVIPFLVSLAMLLLLQTLLDRTFFGRAVKAVAQDPQALRLVGADPVRVIAPVEPAVGRDYIGRVFAICVLGGMTSLPGTWLAGLVLGVAESLTATFYGPSWSPAVAFGILLLVLALRPAGLLGR